MKKLIQHRWFLGGLGVLALALLIWCAGDLVAIADVRPLGSRGARALAMLALLLAWLGHEWARRLRYERANRNYLQQVAGGGEDEDAGRRVRDDMAQLKARFEQAAAKLAKLSFEAGADGKQYLYQMPLYMFIGAPGSGKTTALTSCGLHFPLAKGETVAAIQGVAGTRNCDWWFTDDAVFLDTAGRYTTQDGAQKADAAAWQGFLDLLKKFRPGNPLNGVILTVSMQQLLSNSVEQRTRYAATVRERVTELHDKLGTRFPLYVMVTKADLMAGFTEYFSDLGHEERSQVWGITFPHNEAAAQGFDFSAAFASAFAGLEKRVNAGLTGCLQAERDGQRRAAIFGFPQQFSLVKPLLAHFIEETFRASRYARQPLLRGIYFTSGTQEGTPLDRVLGTLSRSLNLEHQLLKPCAASGKSFFLMRLLRDVVFPEAGLVGLNRRRARRQRWLLRGGFGALAVLSLLLLGAWSISYSGNKALVRDAALRLASLQEKVLLLPPARFDDLGLVLPALNEARELPWAYAERARAAPLDLTFGLFQGDKLGQQGLLAYRRLLRDALLARIALRIEEQLHSAPNQEILYEALKVYLMLHDDKHLDADAVEAWVVADWSPRLAREDGRDSRKDLAGHVRAALERRPLELPAPMDQALVSAARRRLAASSLPDRIYSRLKLLGTGAEIAPFRLSEATGAGGVQVLERSGGDPLSAPFSSLYTKDGYARGFKAQAVKLALQMGTEERWVLGDMAGPSSAPASLFNEVRRRYLEDYARQWDRLLADIRLKPSNSLADTILYARVLGGADSPLRKLVLAVSRETSLSSDKGAAEQAQDALQGAAKTAALDSARGMLSRLFGNAAPVLPPAGTAQAPELRVEQRFEAMRRLAGSGAAGAPIDTLVAQLGDFYQELTALESGMRAGNVQIQGIASAAKLKATAGSLPVPLAGILTQLLSNSSGQASAAGAKALEAGAQGASAFCDKAVSGRYPFARSAQAEVSTEDFAAVFATGGDLDKYFQANLVGQVDMAGALWQFKAGSDGGAKISPATLRQFQNADTVRKAFFRSGQAGASADLVLVSSEAGAAMFDYDGEQSSLTPGQGTLRLKWPAQRPGAQVRLSLVAGGAAILGEGNWALFRLFDKARPEPGPTPERMRLAYLLDGKKIVLELRASSVLNPFKLPALESFHCPGRGNGA